MQKNYFEKDINVSKYDFEGLFLSYGYGITPFDSYGMSFIAHNDKLCIIVSKIETSYGLGCHATSFKCESLREVLESISKMKELNNVEVGSGIEAHLVAHLTSLKYGGIDDNYTLSGLYHILKDTH